ncbi:hypothetical protein NE686_14065 [Tissierella carlieri]|uniref:Uncharacterized protein n=1 Tax=Tissierella carlieri TaxID=689904 RepID=A0ABT1SCN7_9FIRM|nr:hypothetical protein [Tissierella carlieri]MCQ4924223.1 hypothetical protein [Tissierella carlieri]
MEELIIHLEFAKILGAFALGAIVITFITYLISKKNRTIKYIPGFILILIGIYNLFYVGADSPTLEDVNRLLVVVTTMIAGFIGLSTGLIIGIFKKGRE